MYSEATRQCAAIHPCVARRTATLTALLGAGFDPAGVETLGGFVMSLLGRVPKEGDRIERRGLRFTVEKMSARRVGRVRVERVSREGEAC